MESDLIVGDDGLARCWWPGTDPLYLTYHDTEWGQVVDDDPHLFEKICLEGFQSGLSWITILRKREAFREVFAGFDPVRVASFTERDVERLLQDARIVRHRGKIEATVNNARRALELIEEVGSLAGHLWQFAPPARTRPSSRDEVASTSPESRALAKDLKSRGWRFFGPTTAYAFMQAMGMVDDHVAGCFVTVNDEPPNVQLSGSR